MSTELRLERTGTRQGVARNARGATVRFGPEDVAGCFTPGELLALALAACNLMSADTALTRRLGDAQVTAAVTTVKDADANRYVDGEVRIAVDGGADLDAAAWQELVAVTGRAVERGCTVGRTLDAGMPHSLTVDRAPAQPESPRADPQHAHQQHAHQEAR